MFYKYVIIIQNVDKSCFGSRFFFALWLLKHCPTYVFNGDAQFQNHVNGIFFTQTEKYLKSVRMVLQGPISKKLAFGVLYHAKKNVISQILIH